MFFRKMTFNREVDDDIRLGAGYKWLYRWLFPHISKKNILNVGCWTGSLERLIKNEGCNLTGIDIEEKALEVARKTFPRFSFVRADITRKLPFPKNNFDIVFFFMTIEHLPSGTEQLALDNINKVLKKNGLLFLSTVNNNLIANLFDPCFFLGHRHYDLSKLENMLEKSGFKIAQSRVHGGVSIIFYTFLFYFYKHILRRTFYNKVIDVWMGKEYAKDGFMEIKIRAKKAIDIK